MVDANPALPLYSACFSVLTNNELVMWARQLECVGAVCIPTCLLLVYVEASPSIFFNIFLISFLLTNPSPLRRLFEQAFRCRERESFVFCRKMKSIHPNSLLLFKYLLLSLFLSVPFLLLLLSLKPYYHLNPFSPKLSPANLNSPSPGLKIRPGYSSYENYIQRQLKKTLDPKLREIWTTRDWDRKIQVFAQFFQDLKKENFISDDSKALCIGARVGQEVEALRQIGVSDSVGIDLVPYPPLVIKGDFHSQPFKNESFDFEFSNVFDHALYPDRFVSEIERTLKPGGICVLHVAVDHRADKYSANDLYSVKPLVEMFKKSEMVRIRTIDGFGLDTEIVFRRKR